jgi:mRNA interferase MazF
MRIRKYHVYLADLNPRFGTESGKVRPVVVVQTNMLNEVHPSTVICPLTSSIVPEASLLRVHIEQEGNGLPRPSDVLIDQLRAIDNRRFVKHVGALSLEQKKLVRRNLRILLFA